MREDAWSQVITEEPEVVSKTRHSKTKTEARSTQISKTKHLNLEHEAPVENEAPKNSKTKTTKLETGLSFINMRQSLANKARASLSVFKLVSDLFLLVLAHTCIRQNTVSFEVYINMYVYQKKCILR